LLYLPLDKLIQSTGRDGAVAAPSVGSAPVSAPAAGAKGEAVENANRSRQRDSR
jgi:hypothetical protein